MADLEFNKPILMYPKKHGRKYILSKHFYDRLGITLMHKGREIKDIEEFQKNREITQRKKTINKSPSEFRPTWPE